MIEGLPTEWANDVWQSAKSAGPFGNLGLLIVVIVLWRKLGKKEQALHDLTLSGQKIILGVKTALAAVEKALQEKRPARRKRGR